GAGGKGHEPAVAADAGWSAGAVALRAARRDADPDRAKAPRLIEDAVGVAVAVVDENIDLPVGVSRHQVARRGVEGDEPAIGADAGEEASAIRLRTGRAAADPAGLPARRPVEDEVAGAVPVVDEDV